MAQMGLGLGMGQDVVDAVQGKAPQHVWHVASEVQLRLLLRTGLGRMAGGFITSYSS